MYRCVHETHGYFWQEVCSTLTWLFLPIIAFVYGFLLNQFYNGVIRLLIIIVKHEEIYFERVKDMMLYRKEQSKLMRFSR